MSPADLQLQYQRLDQWIDHHFDQEVTFLQSLVRVPSDTPPGDNATHAEHTQKLLSEFGWPVEAHPVPAKQVAEQGMQSITNLVVRRQYGEGPTIGLNAHGDVVPPGDDWQHPPYGADIVDGRMYGRATAVSKGDFATFSFAVRALEALGADLHGNVELHFTYDEEFGGELGPGWLLSQGIVKPDVLMAAGFSYEIVTAHNGCLQFEIAVQGVMAHAAIPATGVDAVRVLHDVMASLYSLNDGYQQISSSVTGIDHPYLNIGVIQGGTNTNVVPGRASCKIDRRLIPEENIDVVEQEVRDAIAHAASKHPEAQVQVQRILRAKALQPNAGSQPMIDALKQHTQALFGSAAPVVGTPLYADARLYAEAGIPAILYGAGPRTVAESNAKRADEHLSLDDLRGATKVVARTLFDLLRSETD